MSQAFATLIAFASLTCAMARAEDATPPKGLSTSDWSSIRAAYEANRHAVFPVGIEFHARNFAQQWKLVFDGRGFKATPDAGDWPWGLQLVSFGREGAEQIVVAPQCIDTLGGRVSYEWDDSLTEWYVNDRHGLEHGFTVHQPPKAVSEMGKLSALQITLAVRGDLSPRVSGDGRSVAFVDMDGAAIVNYSGLTVVDADGFAVPAWFESNANDDGRAEIRISVDDANARYPLLVDPIAQQAYLKASNTDASDIFGFSVAISGDTVVVGASMEDSIATGVNGTQGNNSFYSSSGAAYVFVRSGTMWSQQAYLKASNTSGGDVFGHSVAISGDTVVIGAHGEDSAATGVNGNQADNSAGSSGAAYVFVRSGGIWSQQAYLKASNPGEQDEFGYSVSVSGDIVVAGARYEDSATTGVNGNQIDNSAFDSGATYVFVRSGTTWTQQAYLKASNTDSQDLFGGSVAVSGETVVVAAQLEDSNATGVNGNGADNSAVSAGAAYVFVRTGDAWGQQAYLKASNTDANDNFGRVSVSGDTVVVGAWGEDSSASGVNGNQADNSAGSPGAAYVFVRNGTIWSQQAYLKASNTGWNDHFGVSVAVSDNTAVIGAFDENSNATGVNGNPFQEQNAGSDSGAAYVFVRIGTAWSQYAYLKASNTGGGISFPFTQGDRFGISVAISGDAVVVGAYQEDSSATGVNGDQSNNVASNSGAAYVFAILDCPGITGDVNCDCAASIADVYAFSRALLTSTANSGCDLLNGDMNSDGLFNGADIQGFVELLVP